MTDDEALDPELARAIALKQAAMKAVLEERAVVTLLGPVVPKRLPTNDDIDALMAFAQAMDVAPKSVQRANIHWLAEKYLGES